MEAIHHRHVDVGGLRLHVATAGPEDGPLCVLLHGFPEFWYGWRHQIGPLTEAGYRVVVPDQRGYGESDKPRNVGAYRLDRLAGDVTGLMDAFGAARAHVVGHDWGAAVAWYLAAASPERVERLAILNVPHPAVMRRHLLTNLSQIRRSWYIFFFQLPRLPEHWIRRRGFRNLKRVFRGASPSGTFSDDDLERYVEAAARPGALRSMIHWYRAAVRRPPPRPASWRITVPTRIVWGRKDVALGEEMAAPSAALCDDADVVFLDDAGHFVQHEEPERVSVLVLEHLATAGRSTSSHPSP